MKPVLFLGGRKVTTLQSGSHLRSASALLENEYGIDNSEVYFTCNGKLISDPVATITQNVYADFRQHGGKGGFGSMLRAIGAQIEKTTNREACRDLSGRRLRDINEEKRLKAWLDKQKDREAEAKERKRKKLEKLMAVPKHDFKDAQYESARSDLTEKVSEAVEEGFKKAAAASSTATGAKRKAPVGGAAKPKKAALWIDDDLGSTTDSDDDTSDEDKDKSGKETTSPNPSHAKSDEGENKESTDNEAGTSGESSDATRNKTEADINKDGGESSDTESEKEAKETV